MRRTLLAIPVAAGAAALAAVLTASLPASGAGSPAGFTYFEHQTEFNAVDNPPTGTSVGDLFALSSDLYTDGSEATLVGHAGVACVQTSVTRGVAGEAECSWTTLLQGGQLTATGLVDLASATTPGGSFTMPIVGGTGRYRNANGEVTVKVVNQNDSWDTFNLS